MSRPTRWAVVVFLSLAPLAGLTYAFPDWPADAGLDLWTVPSLHAQMEQWQHRDSELDAEFHLTERRMATKNETVLDLLDGRITLREAITAFRAANADNRYFAMVMALRYPGASDDEMQARNVLDTAAALLDRDPNREAILARLDGDLRAIVVSDAPKIR